MLRIFIKTIHLMECHSTQDYIKKYINPEKYSEIIVSASNQLAGVGRTGNEWHYYKNAIAFSFTLMPLLEEPTLTSMEIGVLLVKFFQTKFNISLYLKWPNDLLTRNVEKCGGILIHAINSSTLVVGIGININLTPEESKYSKFGFIELYNLDPNYKESLPIEIYNYVLSNRLSINEIKKMWKEYCIHLDRIVKIVDRNTTHIGKFIGLDDRGEALLEVKKNGTIEIERILNGSLFIDA
ncbi:MAG: biotin--[acetyl-CoA-carboxylase] ligase [Bacteriovoracaceae bacterium]